MTKRWAGVTLGSAGSAGSAGSMVEQVGMAGPRGGGFAPPLDARWLLLGSDASARPAIQAIAAGVTPALRAAACIKVHDAQEQQAINSAVTWHIK